MSAIDVPETQTIERAGRQSLLVINSSVPRTHLVDGPHPERLGRLLSPASPASAVLACRLRGDHHGNDPYRRRSVGRTSIDGSLPNPVYPDLARLVRSEG